MVEYRQRPSDEGVLAAAKLPLDGRKVTAFQAFLSTPIPSLPAIFTTDRSTTTNA